MQNAYRKQYKKTDDHNTGDAYEHDPGQMLLLHADTPFTRNHSIIYHKPNICASVRRIEQLLYKAKPALRQSGKNASERQKSSGKIRIDQSGPLLQIVGTDNRFSQNAAVF